MRLSAEPSRPRRSTPTCWPFRSTGRTGAHRRARRARCRRRGGHPPCARLGRVRASGALHRAGRRRANSPVDRILLVNGVRRGRGAVAGAADRISRDATAAGNGRASLALWLRDGEDDDGLRRGRRRRAAGIYRPYAYYGRVRDTEAMLRSVEEVLFVGDRCRPGRARPRRDPWPRESSSVGPWPTAPRTTSLRRRWREVARELTADGCSVEVLGVDGDAAPSAWGRCSVWARGPPTSRG